MAAWLLVAALAPGAPTVAQSIDDSSVARFVEERETFTPDGGRPVDLTFRITREAAAQTPRMVAATHAALTMLSAWFGPMSPPSLIVAGVRWRPGVSVTARSGIVEAPLRWLSPVRDQATERALIDGLVRHYWNRVDTPPTAFEEALILFTASRAIHHQLEGSNFATPRFFGGVVPFPLRSVLLSPPVADPRPRAFRFDEPELADAEVGRGVRALQTLERHFGWPTLLAALGDMRASNASRYDAAALGESLSRLRGTDVRFLVAECFRADAVFDYALASLASGPAAFGLVETTLTIVRHGPGIFAPGADADRRNPSLPVRTRFADGSEVRDVFDGAAPSVSLVYTAGSAAVSAAVDPGVMLLLDVNRENNAIVRDAGLSPLGIRLALNWMAWLQNTVLSYTALL